MKKYLITLVSSVCTLLFASIASAAPVAKWTNLSTLSTEAPTIVNGNYTLTMEGGSVVDGVYTVAGGGLKINGNDLTAVSVLIECEIPDASGNLITYKLVDDGNTSIASAWDNTNKKLQHWWANNDSAYGNSNAYTTKPTRILLAYDRGAGTQTFADGHSSIAFQSGLKAGNNSLKEIRIGAKNETTSSLTGLKVKAIYLYNSRLTAWPAEVVIPAPENPGIIGVNFASGKAPMGDLTQTDLLGYKTETQGGEIQINQWNHLTPGKGYTAIKDINDNTYSLQVSSPDPYQSGDSSTAIEKLTYGYLDSSTSVGTITISLAGLPTSGYDVALICGGDGGTFAPFVVNGVSYTAVDGKTVYGTSGWGTRAGASALTEGTNVLYIPAQTDSVLSIVGSNTNGRGSLAAVMVFPKAVQAITAEATTNVSYSNLQWSNTTGPTATDVATITLADGVTLTIDAAVTATKLNIVCEGNCTIAFDANGDFGTTIVDTTGIQGTYTYQYNTAYTGTIESNTKYLAEGNTLTGATVANTEIAGTGTLAGDFQVDTVGAKLTIGGTYTANGNAFIGGSKGTVEIASGANISVPHLRFVNNNNTNDSVVFNVNGAVTVTTDTTNPYGDRESYKGILFGHYYGTGVYNINEGGRLTAENAYLQIVYTAEAQTLNVVGGDLKVRAISSGDANETITLSNDGKIALAEGIKSSTIVQSYGYGTISAYAYTTTGENPTTTTGWTSGGAATFTDTTNGTTIDPNGLTITFSGALSGAGKIIVEDSSEAGNGTVVFKNMDGFTGTVEVKKGTADMTALAKLPTIAGVAEGATLKVLSDAGAFSLSLSGGAPTTVLSVTDDATFSGTVIVDGAEATVTTADGVTTATAPVVTGNATQTGSMWLWDYEFNYDDLSTVPTQDAGNPVSIGSNTEVLYREPRGNQYTGTPEFSYTGDALYFQCTPYRGASFGTEYTAVMRCMAGSEIITAEDGTKTDKYANRVLIGFGSSTGGSKKAVILATGDDPANGDMQLAFWDGTDGVNTLTPIGGVLNVPNATTAYHTYAFTLSVKNNETVLSVYVDGKLKANPGLGSIVTLGGGFQIGSVHGGVGQHANLDVLDKYPDSGNSGTLDFLRTANEALTADAIKAIAAAYPYVSTAGLATRTVDASGDWVATDETTPWSQTTADGTINQAGPNNRTIVEVTATADATLAMNVAEETSYEAMTVEGEGAVVLTAGEHHVSVADLTVSTDLTVAPEKFGIATFTVDANKTLTLDVTSLLAQGTQYDSAVIPLTGLPTLGIGAAVKTIPAEITTTPNGRVATVGYDEHDKAYKLTIEGLKYKATVTGDMTWGALTLEAGDADAEPGTITLTGSGTVTLPEDTTTMPTGFKLVVAGDINVESDIIETYAADVAVGGDNTTLNVYVAADKEATLTKNVTAGYWVKTGDGTLTLGVNPTQTSRTIKGGKVLWKSGVSYGGAWTVDSGATLDLNGVSDKVIDVVLNGGTFANSGAEIGKSSMQTKSLTLNADSFVETDTGFCLLNSGCGATTLTLNGHKLTKKGTGTFYLRTTTIDSGSIEIEAGAVEFATDTTLGETKPTITLAGTTATFKALSILEIEASSALADYEPVSAEGTIAAENGSTVEATIWTLEENVYVAQVGDTKYSTLQAALMKVMTDWVPAEDGEDATITLLAPVTEEAVVGGYGAVINLNGQTLTTALSVYGSLTFTGTGIVAGTITLDASGNIIDSGEVTISATLSEGAQWDGSTLTAAEAKIGTAYYATFASAMSHATEEANTIVLLKDVTIAEEGVTVLADQDITVDVNGKTITGKVTVNGTLAINETITNIAGEGKIVYTKSVPDSETQKDLNIPANMTVVFNAGSASTKAWGDNADITLNEGSILELQNGFAYIRIQDAEDLTTGGKVLATGNFVLGTGTYNGDVTVAVEVAENKTLSFRAFSNDSDPTFTPASLKLNAGASIANSSAAGWGNVSSVNPIIQIPATGTLSGAGTIGENITLKFADGATLVGTATVAGTATFEGGLTVKVDAVTADAILTAGTISGTPTGTIYVGEATEPTDAYTLEVKENALYIVDAKTYVAQIGDVKYETLADAVDAVNTGAVAEPATITLLADCSGVGVVIKRAMTIDFAGCAYTVNLRSFAGSPNTMTQCFQILKEAGEVTLKGGQIIADDSAYTDLTGTGYGAQSASGKLLKIIVQNYANLTVEDMTLDATTAGATHVGYVLSNNCGTVAINGSTIKARTTTAEGDTSYAFDVCYQAGTYGTGVSVNVDSTSTIVGDIEISGGTLAADATFALTLNAAPTGALVMATGAAQATITKGTDVVITAPDGYEWENDTTLVVKPTEPEKEPVEIPDAENTAPTVTLDTIPEGVADVATAKEYVEANYVITVPEADAEAGVEASYFKWDVTAVTSGEGESATVTGYKATLVLDTTVVKAELGDKTDTSDTGVKIEESTETDVDMEITLKVKEPKAGLWYGYMKGDTLDTMDYDYGSFVRADNNGVALDPAKLSGDSGFVKVVILPYKPNKE